MKAPLMTQHAIRILAGLPDGRVELQRQRARARHQQRQMRAELEAQATRLRQLEELITNIDHHLREAA
ncbi:MAG: hypothetical protein QM581_06495 [Pseudomonas sp.]